MAAFVNAEGGVIYIGVADDGSISGLAPTDVTRCNQLISNAASQHVPSPLTVHTENVLVGDNRVVIVLTVPKGLDKPYFDKNGVIWLKTGADKRRVNSKSEEMSEKILTIPRSAPQHTASQKATALGVTRRTIERAIAALRKEGRLRRIGPTKGGRWEVLS